MNITKTLRFCAVVLAFVALASLAQAEGAVPLIKTRTETYKNVTLVSHNETHVFVQHSRGMATLKLADLDKETLIGLGVIADDRAKEVEASSGQEDGVGLFSEAGDESSAAGEAYVDKLPPEAKQWFNAAPGLIKTAPIAIIVGIAIFTFCLFLFYSFCVKSICEKSGTRTGWWIWIPFLPIQKAALFRAARMSSYWRYVGFALLGLLIISDRFSIKAQLGVLIVGLIVLVVRHVVWCARIAESRGKGAFTILCLLFPPTYPLAFLYLAFSGGSGEVEDDYRPIRLDPLPA